MFPHKLTKREKQIIAKTGLMHFTTEEAANQILDTRYLKSSKIKWVYMFQNCSISNELITYNNLSSKKARIEILNLTTEQLNKLWVRYYDMAIMIVGDFHFLPENKVSKHSQTEINDSFTNKHFCLTIGLVAFLSGFIIIMLTAFLSVS